MLFPVLALAGLLVWSAAAAAPQLPPLPSPSRLHFHSCSPALIHARPPSFTLACPHSRLPALIHTCPSSFMLARPRLRSLTLIHHSPSFAFAHPCSCLWLYLPLLSCCCSCHRVLLVLIFAVLCLLSGSHR